MDRHWVRAVSAVLMLGWLGCGDAVEVPGGPRGVAGFAAPAGSGGLGGSGGFGGAAATGGSAGFGGAAGAGGLGGSGGTGGQPVAECIPDAAEFTSSVLPIVEQRCARCHGTPTNFGAPFSLVDYASVVAGAPGTRIVDRMVAQLGAGTMPPAGNIRPTPDEHDVLVSWASCGVNPPPYPTSLQANRPIFEAPPEPPVGTERVELTAGGFTVLDGTVDLYQNFQFSNVVASDKFVRRFDVTIDKSRVVHHITLHYGSGDAYLYAWAPGTGAVEFPSGGLRITPGNSFRLEIHYNNVAGEGTVADSSGVVMYVAEPSGAEYAMKDPKTFAIVVAPGSPGTATANCTANSSFQILTGMPHMHEIGDSYSFMLNRMDGTKESIIDLTGWSFDLQFFYDYDNIQVNSGDTMTITCNYVNDKDVTVIGGTGTTAEMCYNFMYVTPATAALTCSMF